MATRRVRGETGAIFEVDASMVHLAPSGTDYRTSSAMPHVREIHGPAETPPRSDVPIAVQIAGYVLAVLDGVGIVIGWLQARG
jgi:hypothetical protein